jgi:transposase
MSQKTVKTIPEEELNQLSKEQLVEIIKALQEEVARLKQIFKIDSKTLSKPLSADIHKKSENKKLLPQEEMQGHKEYHFTKIMINIDFY